MGRGRFCYQEVLPFSAMLVVEFTNVGLSTIFKAATLKGLSNHVFMVYSYGISSLVLLPLCYIFYRNTKLPALSFNLLLRFFFLGLMGFTAQYLGYAGIEYSTPTLASAMSNLMPASTFVLAVLFRMEKLELKNLSSQVKIMGTIISIAGALVVVLYEGPAVITVRSFPSNKLSAVGSSSNWVIGGALLAAEYILVAVWYIYQTKAVKEYPAEMVVVFFFNLFACIVAAPVCLIAEPNLSAWKVQPDIRLLSILYAGIVGSSLGIGIHTWGLHVKGPVYVALFRPVSIVIAALTGVIFLGDNLYLGSIIGGIVISLGFYIVIWGKAQEEEDMGSERNESSSEEHRVPLL
ncbi:hypothetical protein M9H77_15410 [Catharanthus roseus]|uniref:Uncharacterized protein n=1 Tax=Catharanthus roseus TaxID=4058 RepID=A0ACC0AYN3_CATRO|nr:hypothetical protein M9H77_15410 [Catharanthus roseus]